MTLHLCSIALVSILMQPVAGGIRIVSSAPPAVTPARVVRAGAPIDTQSRTLRLSIPFPSGKAGYGDVTILFEPTSKLLWWFFEGIERADDPGLFKSPFGGFVLGVADDKIAGFTVDGSVLWIRDSTAHVPNLDGGQADVLARIKENAARIDKGTMEWGRSIPLGSALPDFFLLKGSAGPAHATIRQVSRTPGQWRLLLDGPNKNSAEVILDDEYKVIRATVLPSSP